MPKKLADNLLTQVKAELVHHSQGAAIESLLETLGETVSRRTLQRRLAAWVRGGDLKAAGKLKGRRYFLPGAPHSGQLRETEAQGWYAERYAQWARTASINIGSISYSLTASMPGYYVREPAPDLYIPLSSAAEEARRTIKRPLIHRTPVGYRREFLDTYIPNETRYLPQQMLAQLHLMGRLPDHDKPAGSYARKILNRLLIDLSWASSRLEGNTYSLLETQKLIEAGEVASGKDITETRMILNHKAAIELLVESAEEVDVNRYTLFELHGLLAEGLLDSADDAGKLRNSVVGIGGSVYSPPVPELIDESFCMLLDKAAAIEDPFEQSFFLMVQLPYLQPFIDVNKRTSRLAANIPLIKKNCVPLSFIAMPENSYADGVLAVYEFNRVELLRDVYMWAYERSCKRYRIERDSLPEPDPFRIKYRNARITVVQHIVINKLEPEPARVRELAQPLVQEADMDRFVDMLMQELQSLREGILARFQLRRSEFQAWKQLYPGVDGPSEAL